jgi:8-oxo-dGTP diphosphatase
MQPFLTLDETSIDSGLPISSREGYFMRETARAVVHDDDGRVALLHVARDHYYKLPGGGIDTGEDPLQALERELMEEIGCQAQVTHELGTILEQRYYWNMTQVSHCYIAHQTGEKGNPDFTDLERESGFEIVWAQDINQAIRLLESSADTGDAAELGIKFMRLRDVAIAKKAKDTLEK